MKKDILIALGLGFILGSIVALAIVNLPTLFKEKEITQPAVLPSPTPEVTKIATEAILEIEAPQDGSLSNDKTITLSGKTKSGNTLVIETDLDSKIVEATGAGSFSNQISLSEGVNNIYITSFDEAGESLTKIITVFYTSEKI